MTEHMGRRLQCAEDISIVIGEVTTFRNTFLKLLNIGDRPSTVRLQDNATANVDGIVRCYLIDVQSSRD